MPPGPDDPLSLVGDRQNTNGRDRRMANREQGGVAHETQKQGIAGRIFGSIDNAPVNSMAFTLVLLALTTAVLAFKESGGVEVTSSVMAAIIGYFAGKHSKDGASR